MARRARYGANSYVRRAAVPRRRTNRWLIGKVKLPVAKDEMAYRNITAL
jgi:hypothetical protein